MAEEILNELKQEFNSSKKELKIKSNLEEINKVFAIKDLALKEDYVPTDLIRAINRGLIDILHNWASYLHGLLVPNPQHMISMYEAQFFDEKEKSDIFKLLNEIMVLSSKNAMLALKQDKLEDAKLLDEIMSYWSKTLSSKLQHIMKKVHNSWVEKNNSKK